MGVDVLYSKLQQRYDVQLALPDGHNVHLRTGLAGAGATATLSDMDNWQFRFRVHRDFYP